MKIINSIFLLILIFTTACGYQAVNNLDGYNFVINKYELTGDKKINFILEKNFKRFQLSDINGPKLNILGESKKNISILSKDPSGNITNYNIEISIEINVFENQKQIDSIVFSENTSYDNLNSKFELKQYENILLKDLTNQIILKINNRINSL